MTYGTAATQDLSDYMTYAAGTDASEKFTYVITGGNSTTATANGNTVNASISGDMLSIPADTNADTYTLTIQATAKEPVISMFTVDYDTEPVTFDVTVAVAKTNAEITVVPQANTLYIHRCVAGVRGVNSSGSDSNGSIRGVDETMEYRVSSDGEWTAVTGTTLTGLEIGTYEVRKSATDNSFPSEAVSIRIVRTYSGSGGSGGGGTTQYAPTPGPTEEPEQTAEPTEMPEATEAPEETSGPSGGDEQSGFTDVPEDAWYKDTVDYVVENGLMNGTTDTEFSPEMDITRGMFVTVLYRTEGSPEAELDYSFADVAADAYYAEAVAWADDNGIVTGYSAEEFVPDQTISREQMAAIIYRYAGHKGEDMTIENSASYTDTESISDYAVPAVAWVSENGIMQGRTDGTFAPADFTTRAEAAAVFERTDKMFG